MMLLFLLTVCLTSQLGLANEVKDIPAPEHGPNPVAMPITTPESSPATASAPRSISCYVCNSKTDTSCFDEKTLRKESIQKCEPLNGMPAIGCWRLEEWVNYDQNQELKEHDRVVRQCAYHKLEHPCIRKSGFGAMISHCFCNTTACNGSLTNYNNHSFFLLFFTSVLCILTFNYFA